MATRFFLGPIRFGSFLGDLKRDNYHRAKKKAFSLKSYFILIMIIPGIQASNFPSLPVAFCNFPSRSLPVKGECDLQFPFPFPGAKKPFPLTPGHCSCNTSVRLGHIHIKESYLINPIYSSFSLVAHTWTYWMVSNSMMVPPCPWVQPSSSSRESHSKPSWSQRPPWL